MEPVDVALAGGIAGIRLTERHRSHSFEGLLLSVVDHGLVNAVLRRQLCHRMLTTQRLQGNRRLELRRMPLPLPGNRVRPSVRPNQA